MTLPAILCKKSQSKHGGGPHPSIPRGTAFLDQKRLSPTTIEKHYIGSMLYAFNFAEETHRAEGGQPLKVVRMLAEDLGRGSYVHEPTDTPSPHESVHEMWEKMCYIKARFAAVYGHEPGIISPSTSSSSNSSSGLFDESSEFDIDSNIEKRVLSTIEEMSECSASVVADNAKYSARRYSSLSDLSTDLFPSTSQVVPANSDFESLQSSESNSAWLDSSTSESSGDDANVSSIGTLMEELAETFESCPDQSGQEYFEDPAYSTPTPGRNPDQSTRSFIFLSGRKCPPASGFDFNSMASPGLSKMPTTCTASAAAPITSEPASDRRHLADLEAHSPGYVASLPKADKTFVGDVEIVLDIAEAFSKVDGLTGDRDLPPLTFKPRKSKSMSNLIHKVFRRKHISELFNDDFFDMNPTPCASPNPLHPLSRSSTFESVKWENGIVGACVVTAERHSVLSDWSSISL